MKTLAITSLALALLAPPPAAGQKDIVDTAVAAGSFDTLAAALQAADLVDALKGDGPFTVFAPTDEAFAALPEGTVASLLRPENKDTLVSVLTYHVVAGRVPAKAVVELDAATTLLGQRVAIEVDDDGVRVDEARVVTTDIQCSNGVIHVIDSVLLPTGDDLVATAAAAGDFGTLLAAAQAAGLAETLADGGPFTVFAPTDAAFAALPEGTVESLLRPENKDELARILTYHVVSGRVYADQVVEAAHVATLEGGALDVDANEHGVRIGGASVVAADIQAANGVIHVIDTVLLPPQRTAATSGSTCSDGTSGS